MRTAIIWPRRGRRLTTQTVHEFSWLCPWWSNTFLAAGRGKWNQTRSCLLGYVWKFLNIFTPRSYGVRTNSLRCQAFELPDSRDKRAARKWRGLTSHARSTLVKEGLLLLPPVNSWYVYDWLNESWPSIITNAVFWFSWTSLKSFPTRHWSTDIQISIFGFRSPELSHSRM